MSREKSNRCGRYIGPIVCAVVMTVLMLGIIWLMVWGFKTDPASAPPVPLEALLVGLPLAVIVGVILALIQRLRELGRGEEDDAKRF